MSFDYQSKGEQVKDPIRITAILQRLQKARSLLSVIVHGAPERYNSLLLEVNPDEGYLLLDELNPHEGHTQLMRAKRMRVYGMIQGVQVDFSATVEQTGQDAKGATYRIPFPEVATYLQRRSAFRVALPRSSALPIQLHLNEGYRIEGVVVDLSAGGVRARFPLSAADLPRLKQGDILTGSHIQLDAEQRIESKVEVRFAAYDEDQGELVLGCRFVEADRADIKRIERAVMVLQREQRKKMSAA